MKRWYGAMVAVTLPFAVFEVVLVLLLAIGTFPDLSPNTAGGDLDRCWAVGLNMSVAKGMVYGRDVAWTYGPLGFIFWVLDIGHNVESAVCFRLLIFALFWCCIALQVHSSRRVLAGVLLVSVAILSGVDIFCYDVLLISVIGFTTQSWLRKSFLLAIPAAFLTGLGLVAKINIGIGCCMSMIAWGSLVFLERPTRGTLVRLGGVAAVAGLSLLGLFCAYGGPLSALPAYFYTSFLIASGYSAQMSLVGPTWDLWLGLSQLALLAMTVAGAGWRDRRYWGVFLLLVPALFVLFKVGYVRHDVYHSLQFVLSMPVVAGLLLACARRSGERLAVAVMVLALLMMSVVYRVSVWQGSAFLIPPGPRHLALLGHWSAVCREVRQASAADEALQKLPAEVRTKIANQPVDIYPQEICCALANNLNWKPRPVFQSYCAYHPALDEMNARHYRGPDAPTFILYRSSSIDDLHPLLVDPLTWLELFRWYRVEDHFADALLLKRLPSPRFGEAAKIGDGRLQIGQRLEIPEGPTGLLLLQASFRLNMCGRLKETFYKVIPPKVIVEYRRGATMTFGFTWRNAASGLIVSDLPHSITGVEWLWRQGLSDPVRAITFQAGQKFHRELVIHWLKIPWTADMVSFRGKMGGVLEPATSSPADFMAFRASKQVLLRLDQRQGFAGIQPLHDMVIHPKADSLVMTCTGADPYGLLPKVACPEQCDLVVRCDIVSPVASCLQLFYPILNSMNYNGDHVATVSILPGANVVYLRIPSVHLAGPIRIDPIAAPAAPGECVLQSIEIRAVPAR